MKICIHCML